MLLVVMLLFEVKPYRVHLLLWWKIKLRIIHRFPHRVRQHRPRLVHKLKRLIGVREPVLMRIKHDGEPPVLRSDVVSVLNEPDELEDRVVIRLLTAVVPYDSFLGGEERIGDC